MWGRLVAEREMSEGYPTGRYTLKYITAEDIHALANVLIALPDEEFEKVRKLHGQLEYIITRGL